MVDSAWADSKLAAAHLLAAVTYLKALGCYALEYPKANPGYRHPEPAEQLPAENAPAAQRQCRLVKQQGGLGRTACPSQIWWTRRRWTLGATLSCAS